jgi:hypothetical protein
MVRWLPDMVIALIMEDAEIHIHALHTMTGQDR